MDKENLDDLLSDDCLYDDDLFDEDGWTKDEDLGEWQGSIDEWEFPED